jgi:hypothetical protein
MYIFRFAREPAHSHSYRCLAWLLFFFLSTQDISFSVFRAGHRQGAKRVRKGFHVQGLLARFGGRFRRANNVGQAHNLKVLLARVARMLLVRSVVDTFRLYIELFGNGCFRGSIWVHRCKVAMEFAIVSQLREEQMQSQKSTLMAARPYSTFFEILISN